MHASQLLLHTIKEAPADATIASHSLLLRAGYVLSVGSGLYNWLPLGWRVLSNVKRVIRHHMDAIGMQEIGMTMVQPAELWQQTDRWQRYGRELLRFKDRHDADFCLGPTHEEVATFIAKQQVHSRKQLPFGVYQVQTKFRDEIRPRFGIMRAREFIMKDGYSFHEDIADFRVYYDKVQKAYSDIFSELGLVFRLVAADSGQIGGAQSHEFHALTAVGEDDLAVSDDPLSTYATNFEAVSCEVPQVASRAMQPLEKVFTPKVHSIKDVSKLLNVPDTQCIKLLVVRGRGYTVQNRKLIALALCGHHQLNETKASKHQSIASPCTMATDDDLATSGLLKGYIGPIGLKIPLLVDNAASVVNNFSCGANQTEYHYINANWRRDCGTITVVDLRSAVSGEASPCGKGKLLAQKGMEIGHIFQLGDIYSAAIDFRVSGANGKLFAPIMGCYGIGVSRLLAALVEQNHDKKGIIWPQVVAPFIVAVAALNGAKSTRVMQLAQQVYDELRAQSVAVLLDDRPIRVGTMLADLELIGIPWIVLIGDRGLANGECSVRNRSSGKEYTVDATDCAASIFSILTQNC